jgi:toxin HigB-1
MRWRAIWSGLRSNWGNLFSFGDIHTCDDARFVTQYVAGGYVIENFKHKGLRRFYEASDASGIRSDWLKRIRPILATLDTAEDLSEVNFPGLRLHSLKGDLQGFYAVDVSGNWRIIFRFENGKAWDIDLVDYH